ncbi:testicular haploid expressed gene protein [Topomyia yanbarensis]|uniref:testicular haploid expressed gene protein n=1 Tax=Topomyia yanbarensis TaxID=2498891 RepID=UPI00273A79BC|nr:testicular haploid expressed gene protein [Topomyia yanbarensis]
MVNCFSEEKAVKVPNFSYKKSFLYTPCNCPVVDCSLSGQEKQLSVRKYKSSRRIRKLARPKCPVGKFYQRPVRQYGRTFQMIRSYQEPYASTRVQQLAVPKVRKLLAAREEYKRFINRCWYDRFSKRIKRSMFTVYSRLANVQLPQIKPKPSKMTPEQWQIHQQWLKINALHKNVKSMKMKPRKRMNYSDLLERIISLSTPRWETKKFTGQPKFQPVKPSALNAVATERMMQLCIPRERNRRAKGPIKEDTAIPEDVLKAVASERVVELSRPKVYTNVKNEYRENPFTVAPGALKAKPSERILELAKPKKPKKK